MVDETISALTLRVCNKCNIAKATSDFYKRPDRVEIPLICKQCVQVRYKNWKKTNRAHNEACPPNLDGTLFCIECNIEKPKADFGIVLSNKSGFAAKCLDCSRIYDRVRYQDNPELRRETAKWAGLKMRVGITRQEWFALYLRQEKKCAVCRRDIVPSSRDQTRGCVDHCHETKKVRGLLCPTCNQGIGLLKDDPDIMERAATYIRRSRSD